MPKSILAAMACAICMSLGLAPLFIGTFPLFLQPISTELHWGAAVFPQAAMIAGVAGALLGPVIGGLIDKFGVRSMMLCGLTIWAAMLYVMSTLNGSYAQLVIIASVMGIAAAACGPIAFAKVISGWFDRNRGIALAVVMSAAPAIATSLFVVMTGHLLADYDWRTTYRILAAVVFIVALPVAFFWLREAPLAAPAEPSVMRRESLFGTGSRAALKSRDFWTVMALTGMVCGVTNAFIGHFVAWSTEHGVSLPAATYALSAFSLIGPLGPLLAGMVADRVSGPRPLVIFFSLPFIAIASLMLIGPSMLVPAMVLLGVGFSATTGMLPYLLTRYFGVRHASQVFGLGLGITTLSMGSGPVILGFARDSLHSFEKITPILAVILLGAVIVSLMLRRYQTTAEIGNIDIEASKPAA